MSPPATVAHFKHRVPQQPGSGPCNDQLPPAKRARESHAAAAEPAKAAVADDEQKAAEESSPQADKKFIIKWKCPLGEECKSSMGNYDISDPETLDCSICSHPLSLPVHQCRNGHTACQTCWKSLTKAKKTCHSCEEKTWDIRCIVVEKILEHLSVRCKNSVFGCNEFVGFLTKREHEEELCRFRPYRCAVHNCDFEGPKPSLMQHFDKQHQLQAVQFDTATRKAAFSMKSDDRYKLVQNDHELYMVYHDSTTGNVRGDVFYCAAFGPYKKRYRLTVSLESEGRGRAAWGANMPEVKGLEAWLLKRDYITLLEAAHAEPRVECEFDMEMHLFPPAASSAD